MRMAEEQVRSLFQQVRRCNEAARHRGGVDGAKVFAKLLPEKFEQAGKKTEGEREGARSWLRQSS